MDLKTFFSEYLGSPLPVLFHRCSFVDMPHTLYTNDKQQTCLLVFQLELVLNDGLVNVASNGRIIQIGELGRTCRCGHGLFLTLNIPCLARQRCLPSWGPRRTPWFFVISQLFDAVDYSNFCFLGF